MADRVVTWFFYCFLLILIATAGYGVACKGDCDAALKAAKEQGRFQ